MTTATDDNSYPGFAVHGNEETHMILTGKLHLYIYVGRQKTVGRQKD
jgi:hypothetical protein